MMYRRLTHTLLALSLAGAILCPAAALAGDAPASDKARAEKATELYKQANKLYDEGKLESAEGVYKQAWALQKTYGIASNLGALALDLNKPATAAEMLRYALAQFPAKGKPETREALEARFEKAKKLACAVRVKVEAGAEVLVDGRSVGTAPLADEVFVEAGSHAFEARMRDRKDGKTTLVAVAGSRSEVSLSLAPLPKIQAPPAASSSSGLASKWPLPGLVMGAAGVVAMGVGGAFVGMAEKNHTDATALRDRLAAGRVSCATASPDCTALHNLTSQADTFGNTGIGLLIGGGVTAAAGVAYVLWPASRPDPKKKDTKVAASFGASPDGAAVTVSGSF